MNTLSSIELQQIRELFSEPIPTLQEMASVKVALCLWYNLFSEETFNETKTFLGCMKTYNREMKKSLRNLTIPHLIQEIIKKSIMNVVEEIDKWTDYIISQHFSEDQVVYVLHHDCCVWKSNGKINYRRSARKMLSLPNLCELQKFDIMCKYCFEDEIRNLPTDAEPKGCTSNVERCSACVRKFSGDTDYLRCYWTGYLETERYKVSECQSSETFANFMSTETYLFNQFAFEYFWGCLSEENQLAQIRNLLTGNSYVPAPMQKLLFYKIKDGQLGEILREVPCIIIINFLIILNDPESALGIWIRLKNSLMDEQFLFLIRTLQPFVSERKIENFILEVFDSANDHQKRYLLDQNKEIITIYSSIRVDRCLKFLIAALSYTSLSYRKNFILEHGENLVATDFIELNDSGISTLNKHFFEMDTLIKLCLKNDDEITLFKKRIMKSVSVKNYCNRLFLRESYEYLKKFVEFYFVDKFAMKEFEKQILESHKPESAQIFKNNKWSQLEALIEDAYPDASLSINVKKQFILSSAMNCFFHYRTVGTLYQCISITSQFLTNEEIAKLKETLSTQAFKILTTEYSVWYFNDKYWTEFTSWCLGDENKIKEFKMSLFFDKVFDKRMKCMWVIRRTIEEILQVLDSLLKWYFVKPELIKEYKLQRIFTSNLIESLVSSITRREEQDSRILLTWFLDNDQQQISKFKSKFSDSEVSKMI